MRVIYHILPIFATIYILTGCFPTRHLEKDQYLLYKQSIRGNNLITYEELTSFYRQKANRRFLGFMPYVSIYNFGKKFYHPEEIKKELDSVKFYYQEKIRLEPDSAKRQKLISKGESKIESLNKKLHDGNWIMRAPGEAPVIYDSALVRETVRQMQYYIFSKGFFHASVRPTTDTTGKKIRVRYEVHEGDPHRIYDIQYRIDDPQVASLVKSNLKESSLKVNERYDLDKLSEERERITKLLKNNGYFDFTRQYIFYNVDTTAKAEKVAIDVIIKNPKEGNHIQYTIDSIFFEMNIVNQLSAERDTLADTLTHGIFYTFSKKDFSQKILKYKLRFKPGEFYSQKKVQETQNQLASLDMYKFININFVKNQDTSIHSLNAYVRTSPFNKYQISDEWGVNVGQGFIPGPYASLTFKDRNVFRGFEIFEASLRFSMEAVYPQNRANEQDKPILMKEYGGTVSLTFPQILFPGFEKKVHHYNPKTRIQLGYNFVNRPEYTRSMLRSVLSYNWQRSIHRQYNINLLDINIINTQRIDQDFKDRLLRLDSLGNKLIVSFNNSIVTSFNTYFLYNNNDLNNTRKRSKYFKPYFEVGGNMINALSRWVTREPGNKFLGLQYFEFFKLSADYRIYLPAGRKNTYAMRFYGGYARPYGTSAQNGTLVLPYEKYFFAGGSSSIRAWKPRRLGPGSFKDTVRGYLYEQPGQIIFEANQEFRFDMIRFVEGALFVDAGNVWTIREDPGRPGSQFRLDSFLKQIAVGAGFGFRLDFTFLILRFDIGTKIWDPGEPPSNRFVGKYLLKNPLGGRPGQTVFNIGIGYPF